MAIGAPVRRGEHRQHGGHAACRRRVDPHDPRMRVRRAHHHRMGLAFERDVVGIAPGAAHEAQVLEPRQRPADVTGGSGMIGQWSR
jgi:hypothetical protein